MSKPDPQTIVFGALAVGVLYMVYKTTSGAASVASSIGGGISSAAGAVADASENAWYHATQWFDPGPQFADITLSSYSAGQVAQMMPAQSVQRLGDDGATFGGIASGNQLLWWSDPSTRIGSGPIGYESTSPQTQARSFASWGETPPATARGGLGSSVY
jgi:hypothetical protein